MDFKTASAVIRAPWLIEENWASAYWQMFQESKDHGKRFKAEDESKIEAVNPRIKFFASSSVKYAPIDGWTTEAETFTGFEGATIAVIPLEGPLMKNDYCGYYGTSSMLNFFRLAEQASTVKEIVLLIDSPGGTVDGTAIFADVVAACTKPVTAVISGLGASAAYWIASSAKEIIATSKTDITGSIGTMIRLTDYSKYYEDLGIVERNYTATESKDKNKAYLDAEKGDGKMLIKTLLDPLNDVFIESVTNNRGSKLSLQKENVFTAKTYVATEALQYGLIDRIQPFEAVMETITKRTEKNSDQPKIFQNMKWTKILAFFGLASTVASASEVKLEDGQLDKLEALVAERDTLASEKATLTIDLETAKTALATATADLATANANLATATANATKATEDLATAKAKITEHEATIATLNAKVKELGEKDATRFTAIAADKDDIHGETDADANSLAFQKEIYDRVNK